MKSSDEDWKTAAVERLSEIIERTDFSKEPYRGILTKVAEDLGYKGGRQSVHAAIKRHKNLSVLIAVVKEIEGAEEMLKAQYASLGKPQPDSESREDNNLT